MTIAAGQAQEQVGPGTSDRELLRAAISGDESAFSLLTDRHSPATLAVLAEMLSMAGVSEQDARHINSGLWFKFEDPMVLKAFDVTQSFRSQVEEISVDHGRWELADMAHGGDDRAYNRLQSENWRWTRGALSFENFSVREEDRDDVTQDTWMHVLAALTRGQYSRVQGSFPNKGSFRGWMKAIARNCAVDYYRRVKPDRTEQLPDPGVDGPVIQFVDESVVSPEAQAEIEEELGIFNTTRVSLKTDPRPPASIVEAYDRLPIRSRLILGLREGLPDKRLVRLIGDTWQEALARGVAAGAGLIPTNGLQGPVDPMFDWSEHVWLAHATRELAKPHEAILHLSREPSILGERLLAALTECPGFKELQRELERDQRLPPVFYEIRSAFDGEFKVNIVHIAELFNRANSCITGWHKRAKAELLDILQSSTAGAEKKS